MGLTASKLRNISTFGTIYFWGMRECRGGGGRNGEIVFAR